jgi:NDP-mannose synthase
MPVGAAPILEILVNQLVRDGFGHITITLGHLGKLIRVYFGDGSEFGCRIDYTEEPSPLGTMGPLRAVKDLPDNFLVLNGDILTDLSFKDFFEEHKRRKRLFSISAYHRELDTNLGVLEANSAGDLVGFREKPKLPFDVSMGIYAASREVLDEIPDGRPFGFDDLMLKLLSAGKRPLVVPHRGYWLDIGRPEDFERAQTMFGDLKPTLLRNG